MKKFKIAYCAGHHLGNPKGVNKSMGFGSIREWTLNDRVADHFAEAANQYENVELLRTDDPTGETLIDIPERCAAANKWGADLYIDMHHNGGADGTSAGGVVAFSRPKDEKSGAYAEAIYNAGNQFADSSPFGIFFPVRTHNGFLCGGRSNFSYS
jgi:N-acetylmuramoyl-L-alanine amidase